MRVLLIASILISFAVSGVFAVDLYTLDNPPATPALEDLPLQSSVTKDGITWTFAQPARVGQFVNGDYYVVGPVTVTAIDPPTTPTNGRNGTRKNMGPTYTRSGFDDRMGANRFDASLRDYPPLTLQPTDSLVSTISVQTVGTITCILRSSDATHSPVRTASVLTCVANPLPPDAFRPSFLDHHHTKIYLSRNLKRDLLQTLPKVSATRQLSEFEGYFRRPWIDVLGYEYDFPIEYMAQYPRETLRATGMASLMLMLDFTPEQKEALLVYLMQYGIDLYGIVEAGHPGWHAHGGHGNGRKWPIVFAGLMFDEDMMARVSTHYPNTDFSEDQQVMYDDGWTGANVVYAGHYGMDGHPSYSDWGPYEHLEPKDWPGTIGESYRRCCTSIGWVSIALAGRMMRAEQAWGYDAFFDYADRWMTEDDTQHVQIIQQQIGANYGASWQAQGQAWDTFTDQMWYTYRDQFMQGIFGRYVFYNHSKFDGSDPAANAADDDAVAPDKLPLLPGEIATFANYTSYDKGINGVMIDIKGLTGQPTAADFQFNAGNTLLPASWPTAPAPQHIAVRPGAGVDGSDRITIIWADNAIRKQWLKVTVKATDITGLSQDDVFYFGNAPGETGDQPDNAIVDATDEVEARNNTRHFLEPALIDNLHDYNRDGRVDATDEIIARNNATTFTTSLRMLTAPTN